MRRQEVKREEGEIEYSAEGVTVDVDFLVSMPTCFRRSLLYWSRCAHLLHQTGPLDTRL